MLYPEFAMNQESIVEATLFRYLFLMWIKQVTYSQSLGFLHSPFHVNQKVVGGPFLGSQ